MPRKKAVSKKKSQSKDETDNVTPVDTSKDESPSTSTPSSSDAPTTGARRSTRTKSSSSTSEAKSPKSRAGKFQCPWDVACAPLYKADQSVVADILNEKLKQTFKEVEVKVVTCPDLTDWGLAAAGITGDPMIVDIGGVPNLMDPQYHGVKFDAANIAKSIGMSNCYFLGAGAAVPSAVGGANAELISSHNVGRNINKSQYAKVGNNGEGVVGSYDCDDIGLLCNLLASKGQRGKVIEVHVKQRISDDNNFVSAMRRGLLEEVGKKLGGHVGLGGVFRIVSGKIKAHIMPDFKKTVMVEGPEVEEWLKFYTMGPNLVCPSVFLTGDPTLPFVGLAEAPIPIEYRGSTNVPPSAVTAKPKAKAKAKAKAKGGKGKGKGKGTKRKGGDDDTSTSDDKEHPAKEAKTEEGVPATSGGDKDKESQTDVEKPAEVMKDDSKEGAPSSSSSGENKGGEGESKGEAEQQGVKYPGLNLRLEHTHFFNEDMKKQEAGHYHKDITPDEVEYHGYFVVGHRVWRLGNASQRSLCPAEFYSLPSSTSPARANDESSSSSSSTPQTTAPATE